MISAVSKDALAEKLRETPVVAAPKQRIGNMLGAGLSAWAARFSQRIRLAGQRGLARLSSCTGRANLA